MPKVFGFKPIYAESKCTLPSQYALLPQDSSKNTSTKRRKHIQGSNIFASINTIIIP